MNGHYGTLSCVKPWKKNLIFFNGIDGKLYHLIKLCVRNTQYKVLFVGKLQIRNL